MSLDALSLRARRLALGLSQEELGRYLDVPQNTISKWENAVSAPRDPVSIDFFLDELGDAFLEIVDECLNLADDETALANSPHVIFYVYQDDAALAKARPDLHAKGIAASMHRQASAIAALMLKEEGIDAVLRDGGQ